MKNPENEVWLITENSENHWMKTQEKVTIKWRKLKQKKNENHKMFGKYKNKKIWIKNGEKYKRKPIYKTQAEKVHKKHEKLRKWPENHPQYKIKATKR